MQLCEEVIKVTTAGGAGAAIGNSSSLKLRGLLVDIYLKYHASAPATTDVTITHETAVSDTLLAVADANTSKLFSPRAKPVDSANAPITNAHDKFALIGSIKVAVAQCNALTDAVIAYVRYLRL